MADDVLLGPEPLEPMTSMDQLKARLMPRFPPPGLSVSLLIHDAELDSLEGILKVPGDDALELTAVFQKEELSDDDREKLLNEFDRIFSREESFFYNLTPIARGDKHLVLQAFQEFGRRISHRHGIRFQELRLIHESLRVDYDVVLAAVKINGLELEHAHESLQAHHDIVLAAVKQNAFALRYASYDVYGDCEIIRAAVEARRPLGASGWTDWNSPRLFKLLAEVPEVVRSDVGVMKAAAFRDGRLFWFALGAAREDPKVIRAATKSWLRGQFWDFWDMPEAVLAELGLNGTDPSGWFGGRISSTDVCMLPWKTIARQMKNDERTQAMRDRLVKSPAKAADAPAAAAEEERWIAARGKVVPRNKGRKLQCHEFQRRTRTRRLNHLGLPQHCAERRKGEGQRKSKRMRRRASHRNSFAGIEADDFENSCCRYLVKA